MDWEQRIRRTGGSLAGLSLFGVLVGGLLYLYTVFIGDGSLADRATQLIVGSLIAGLIGSMLLLLAPDTLPPEQRP